MTVFWEVSYFLPLKQLETSGFFSSGVNRNESKRKLFFTYTLLLLLKMYNANVGRRSCVFVGEQIRSKQQRQKLLLSG